MSKFNCAARSNKGFTTIELMVAIVILSFISMAGYALLDSSSIVTNKQMSLTNERNDLRMVLLQITEDIQQSTKVNNAYSYELSEETVNYSLEGDRLHRNGFVLAERVDDFQIYIIESDGGEEKYRIDISIGEEHKYVDVVRRLAAGVQAQLFSISGVVREKGNPSNLISEASLVFKNKSTNQQYVVITNSLGNYSVDGLSAGIYELVVTKEGYKVYNDGSITVNASVSGQNIELELISLGSYPMCGPITGNFKGKEIDGYGATITFKENHSYNRAYAEPSLKLEASNMYFDNGFTLKNRGLDTAFAAKAHVLGSPQAPKGSIYVNAQNNPLVINGSGEGSNLNIVNSINIYSDIYVYGDAVLERNIIAHGNIYVTGNLTIRKGGHYYGEIKVGKNLIFDDLVTPTNVFSNIYVGKELQIKNGLEGPIVFNNNSNIYYESMKRGVFLLRTDKPISYKGRYNKSNNVDVSFEPSSYPNVSPCEDRTSIRDLASLPGYSSSGTITSNSKHYRQGALTLDNGNYNNLVLASQNSNITINGNINQGLIYAPNGTVTITSSEFKGSIIAKEINVTNSNASIVLKDLVDLEFINSADYPFTY